MISGGGDFTFNYSSKSCSEFARSAKITIPFKVHGGLEVFNFDIFSSTPSLLPQQDVFTRDGFCLLVFEVVNSTSRTFNLTGIVNDLINKEPSTYNFALEASTVSRVILPIRRFNLNPQEIPGIPEQRGQYVKPAKEFTEKQKFQLRLSHWYKNEILKLIHLTWSCLGYNTNGILQLRNKINLTKRMIERINTNFASFDFLLDKAESIDTFYKKLPSQTTTIISFTIQNESSSTEDYRVHMQPFRDHENNKRDLDLGGKLVWIGKLENIIQLQPKQQHRIDVTVSFLVEGVYNFVAICENIKTGTTCCSGILTVESSGKKK